MQNTPSVRNLDTSSFALVTGACGGIGSEVARRLHRLGYRLLLVDLNAAALDSLSSELGGAQFVVANLSSKTELAALQARLEDPASKVEVAFINAGVIVPGDLVEMTQEQIDLQMDVNLNSAIHLIQSCAKSMKARKAGRIVATVSVGGVLALKGSAVYSASKFGLRGLLAGLRDELKEHGVNVSGIYPSGVDTKMLRHEAEQGGSALNFVSEPQTVQAVGDAFERALKTGKLEVYVPYFDGLLARCLAFVPGLVSHLYPLLQWLGEQGRQKYLAKIRQSVPNSTTQPNLAK
jgi:short-subunit dehydrogenase